MAINVNNNPTQAQVVNQQQAKAAQLKPSGITGAAASANLAAMVAGSELPSSSVPSGAQGSLLGALAKESPGNASAFGGGNRSFSLAMLGGSVGGKPQSVLDNPAAGLQTRDRQAMNTAVGQSLAKVMTKMENQVMDKTAGLAALAQNALANNPAVKEAAAKAAAAGMGWSSSKALGKAKGEQNANAEASANANGADGKVFGDFVQQAGSAAKAAGLDITQMPIEDAMVYMTMLCSNDARDDLKDMLSDMEGTRKKRAALREAQTLMKEQQDKAKEKLTSEYNALSPADKTGITLDDYMASQPADMTPIVMNYDTGTASYAGGPEGVAGANSETIGGTADGAAPLKYSDLTTMSDNLGTKKDSLADISQEQQLKMQMVMESMTKMEQLASNISKKINDTVMSIVGNFK